MKQTHWLFFLHVASSRSNFFFLHIARSRCNFFFLHIARLRCKHYFSAHSRALNIEFVYRAELRLRTQFFNSQVLTSDRELRIQLAMKRIEDENVELISIVVINEELRIVTLVSHFHELKAEYSTSLSWKSEDFYIVDKQ